MATFKISQEGRWLHVKTPFYEDGFVLVGLQGAEGLSKLYSFELTMLSDKESMAPVDTLGKSVTVTMSNDSGGKRIINGIVKRFSHGPMVNRTYREFRAEIVPTLWLLTRNTDCQIFQNMTAVDVIKSVLGQAGLTNYQIDVTGTYRLREYCVQYRETDFAFISRLMEEEGIFYYFKHTEDGHTLVLTDKASNYTTASESEVEYRASGDGYNVITRWEPAHEYRSGKASAHDWDFTNASVLFASTNTKLDVSAFKKYEQFDYPGNFTTNAEGTTATTVRMEEEEAGHAECLGTSTCGSFLPGAIFKLVQHDLAVELGSYVLTDVRHSASDRTVLGGGAPTYANEFRCLPSTALFRPPRVTPRAMVHGPQTAIVVGPDGQEMYCDEHGRVRVQFHWDRLGKMDANSSCWVRVAQMLAGSRWGTQFIPRMGMEVVVVFLEGDPDRPLITGCVYNGINPPPYTLPDNMTQSGFKSRSTLRGTEADFNELRFEDKKDAEQIYFHAQKDFVRFVENDDTLTVGNAQTRTIKESNRTVTLEKGNDSLTVSKGHRTVTVSEGNDSLTVGKGNHTVTVSEGSDSLTVSKGDRTVTVSQGDDSLTVSQGSVTIEASASTVTVKAGQSIELKVGSTSIKLDTQSITLSSPTIKLSADGQLSAQGSITEVKASGIMTISGALVKIN